MKKITIAFLLIAMLFTCGCAQGLVATFKVATNWSTYADQIRAIEDYPDICG